MNIKKNFLFLIMTLVMTFLLPNYAMAAFTFTAHDTKGALLNFSNPVLIAGAGVAAGAGTASVGAKFKYTNVITVDGVQIDAIVSVDSIVNMTITKFDDPKPNPTPKDAKRKTLTGTTVNYVTSFGGVVPEGAIFAPQLTATSHTADSHVDFTISFQDTAGKPVVLQNVYNNSLDDESVEYNEFGGFNSFAFASDYKTNTVQHMVASAGLGGKVRFSNSNCPGNAGLYITDSSRVQTFFKTITSLKLTLGQFANGTVPTGVGTAVSTCTNTSVRYYGAIFAQDGFVESTTPPVQITAPTVDLLTTSNTKPAVTGTVGGVVSGMTQGSALLAGETLSVTLNGTTYTTPNANLVINNINWTLNVPTALAVGTYEVTAARTGGLIDQTNNELTITPICVAPQILNLTLTACVLPSVTDTVVCHTGDMGDRNGDGVEDSKDDALRHYVKEIIPSTGINGHETHVDDKEAGNGASGKSCPDDAPVCVSPAVVNPATNTCMTPSPVCLAPQILNSAATACITPVTNGTACTAVTSPLPTVLPTNTDYDGKKISICHFPPGNPNNVQLISVSLNALSTHVNDHGDSIWQSDKNCPATSTSCDVPVSPTVDTKTTTTLVAPTLTGSVGTSSSLTITVNGVSGTATISGTTWSYSPGLLPIGAYEVIATGDALHGSLVDSTHNELTVTLACPTGQVVNSQGTGCIAPMIPTVISVTVDDKHLPTLTGNVGTSSSLKITINGVGGTATINAAMGTWSYTFASTFAAGTYNVVATGDTGLVDTSTGELSVTATVIPTVTSGATTTDKIVPILSGTFGTSASLTITAKNSISNTVYAMGSVTKSGTASTTPWTMMGATVLPAGTYDVIATGDVASGSLVDNTSGELKVTITCTSPATPDSAGLTCTTPTIPTVDSGKIFTDVQKPTLTGTVGASTSLTIAVKDSITGAIYATGTPTLTGIAPNKTWSLTTANTIPAGTYNVVATGDTGLVDTTTNELTITGTQTGNACTLATNPLPSSLPTGANYSFDDNNCNNNQERWSSGAVTPSIKVCGFSNATDTTVSVTQACLNNYTPSGFDTIWQSSNSNCPTTAVSCKTKPTVVPKSIDDNTVVTLNGTADSAATSVMIVIKNSSSNTQTLSTHTAVKSAGSTTWTLTTTTTLTAGIYDVIATDNYGLVDITQGELTVTQLQIIPTVDHPKTATDLVAPTLTGTFGTSTSLTITATNSTTNVIYPIGTIAKTSVNTWSVTGAAALPGALTPGQTYDIIATGDSAHGSLVDNTSGELTVSQTAVNPTVTSGVTTTDKVAPALSGSTGTSTSLTITVKNTTPAVSGAAVLDTVNKTWTFTPTAPITVAGIYDVEAKGDTTHGSLVDATSGELTVTSTAVPSVDVLSTFDTTPTITGTIGNSALATSGETFTVKVNSQTYSVGTDLTIKSDLTWSLTIPKGKEIYAGNYEVEAARITASATVLDKTHGELTINPCALPKVVNAAGACAEPVPTVNKITPLNTSTTASPVITGTVGDTVLGSASGTGANAVSAETFSVTINTTTPQIYTYNIDTVLVVTGLNWTLTVPTAKAIPVGVYEVEATRNNTSKDITHNELVINLACVSPLVPNTSKTGCASVASFPTVNTLSTDDSTPTITGTVGDVVLANADDFTVGVNGQTYPKTQILISGLVWSLDIPLTNALTPATYDVVATRNGVDKDTTSNELTITQCSGGGKVVSVTTGKCEIPSLIPTVNTLTLTRDQQPAVLTGTVGDTALTNNDTFTVKVHNIVYDKTKILFPTSTTWSLSVPETLNAGTYDVDAVRNTTPDTTSGELIVIGGSCCINGATTQCPSTVSLPDTFGECGLPACPQTNAAGRCTSSLPDPIKETVLPTKPDAKVVELIKPPSDLGVCDDGGIRSYSDAMNNITIKRARIANATTWDGAFASTALNGMNIMYGTLVQGNVSNPTNQNNGYVENVTITGATLSGAYIDIAADYIDSMGYVIDASNSGIALTGGITKPTSTRKDLTTFNATITNGMITSGTDSSGNPVRGSITNGLYVDDINNDVNNPDKVLTKGRRVQGTLANATITGATVTTVGGITAVGCDKSVHPTCTVGTITSGMMDLEAEQVKTFGTVENATLTSATISNSNHCFSSGTVGSKGQLNWKEVVK